MNGGFQDKSPHRSYGKEENRTVGEQMFDNIFYGISYNSDVTSPLASEPLINNPLFKPKKREISGKENQRVPVKRRRFNLENAKNNLNCLSKVTKKELHKPALTNHNHKHEHSTTSSSAQRNEMNEYTDDQNYHHVTNGDSMSDCNFATLLNMGNTCYLNSVLYSLRFTPTFLHNLHHLIADLTMVNGKLKDNKTKTSSLGRNGSAVNVSSWRSSSSKDLLSIGSNDIIPKSKEQLVTEKLHNLFAKMNKGPLEPFQPEDLLHAMRDANSLFEGNQQQDAHECFVDLLSHLRVTCDKLNEQIEQYPELKFADIAPVTLKRLKKKPPKRKGTDLRNAEIMTATPEDHIAIEPRSDGPKKKLGYNFIIEDFQGVSLHRTKCLECEEVSELKEPFLEIQVPINCQEEHPEDGSIFASICNSSEKLCGQNKYFCAICNRLNEAQRTLRYEKLPKILVLHLKRFTTSLSGVKKVTTYLPTPLEIQCFCETCSKEAPPPSGGPHVYRLSCVIMHLGASMASGHYITYARAKVDIADYFECDRDIPKGQMSSGGKELSANWLKFFKPKVSVSEHQNGIGKKSDPELCQSMTCCGIRSKSGHLHNDDWLEFDDEKVKLMSGKDFTDMLRRRQESQANTPYLLFYSKIK